jgi:acyl-coenzyme A thioesterase PaaI-like protein
MADKAIQDYYQKEYSHCFGCGPGNGEGWHIKSYWDGQESTCRLTPKECYTGGLPDVVYGGFIAAVMDCHSIATASAAKLHDDGFELGDRPLARFLTASLKVDYLMPTPVGKALELKAKAREVKGRKVTVAITLSAEGQMCARGEAILVALRQTDE